MKIRVAWYNRLTAMVLFSQLVVLQPTAQASSPAMTAVTVQSAYDANGNLITRTDGNGVVTTFDYDEMNRLVSVDYPGGTGPDISFVYDANGNRIRMTDATGTTRWTYDFYDRLTRIDYPDDNFVIYGYDFAGNITDLKYGNTRVLAAGGPYTYVRHTFDSDNRLTGVVNVFANETTSYTYDDAGHPLRRTLPNGVTTDYSYDGDGRLLSVDHKDADGTRIVKFSYTLNAIGNRTEAVETLPDGTTISTRYTYDPLERLDTVTYADGRFVDYDYGSFGNRAKMTETTGGTPKVTDYYYDTDSRLLSTRVDGVLDETFFYDAEGNLIQRIRASDSHQINYVYDFEHRLLRYHDGANNIQYLYDGMGNRVARVVNGVKTDFLNDPNRSNVLVLQETDPSGNATRVYEWGSELIGQQSGSLQIYHLFDALNGSVRRVVDRFGEIQNTYDYDAFGAPTAETEAVPNDFQFQGESQEDETGLLFLRARYCDVSNGRFLSRDPNAGSLKLPKTQNPYLFTQSDPVNYVDPAGTFAVETAIGIVLAVAGGLSAAKELKEGYESGHTGALLVSDGLRGFGAGVLGTVSKVPGLSSAINEEVKTFQSGFKYEPNSGKILTDGFIDYGLGKTVGAWAKNASWSHESALPIGIGRTLGDKAGRTALFGGTSWGNTPNGVFDLGIEQSDGLGKLGILGLAKELGKNSLGSVTEFLSNRIGGVALDKSATVLLPINNITGGTYDVATGQILLFGKQDDAPTALPPMSVDDLAVVFHAMQLGTFPVVSIEDPIVSSPDWPGRDCGTVRYGPFYTDPQGGQRKVMDVSSNTHVGWVMFEADRLMKCLGLGRDNRYPDTPVTSNVPGYQSLVDLAFTYFQQGHVQTRFWFNPKEIVVEPSEDGTSMEITKAEMQLSTETMFSSYGQVESTPDAEQFANWFTENYDAIAEEQVTVDDEGQPHKIFKELKQLASLAGIVKWVKDNNIPVDLAFLNDYQPLPFPSAPPATPMTTVTETRTSGNHTRTVTMTGGVNFCHDLVRGSGGNPTGLGAAAADARPSETSLAWTFTSGVESYNASALSVDRTAKDGGTSPSAVDAQFQVNGATPLILVRYFDSFNIAPTLFGYGWKAQPFALEFKGQREQFNMCHQSWEGYGEVYFSDRSSQAAYKFTVSGTYDKVNDPLHIASRFDPTKDILFYSHESKSVPGLIFSDNTTRLTMRLDSGVLLDFDLDGLLTRIEDRNGNRIDYGYDAQKRLVSIGQAGTRTITLNYDGQDRVATALLPGGRAVTYTYDGDGNLITAQADAPTGRKLRYAYDADHRITEVQDENGNATASQVFDIYGRVSTTTQPGVTAPFTQSYDLAARTSRMFGPHGVTNLVVFNDKHDPVRITDARNNVTTTEYNSFRSVKCVTRPDDTLSQLYYDRKGRRIATTMPNGRVDCALYDLNGNPTTTFHWKTDAEFEGSFDSEHVAATNVYTCYYVDRTQYAYDPKGNLTGVTDANSNSRSFGYNTLGNMTFSKDARGKQTDYNYDSLSRLIRVRNAVNHQVDLAYDGRDNLTRVTTLAGTVDYGYNTKNQLVSVTTGDLGARRTTSYTFDAKGQLKTVTDPDAVGTEYDYDARGNLIEIKHDGVARFTYDYDELNRLTATHYTGTAGGARAAIIPTSPMGSERYRTGALTIKWSPLGDWTDGTGDVTIQYSTDGANWTTIASVNAQTGEYVWGAPINSGSIQLRFLRSGDAGFAAASTAPFTIINKAHYYVNDNATAGDVFCSEAGKTYNGGTVRGRSPADPVNDPQAIINNYVLLPGDVIHIDTGNYAFDHDILMTETDTGSEQEPIIVEGPTTGPGASITRVASAAPQNATIFVADLNPTSGANMEGITIQNLKVAGGKYGIWLYYTQHANVKNCECSSTSINANPGGNAWAIGIIVSGGGNHQIEDNFCHANEGHGGNGSSGASGGYAAGCGIYAVNADSIAIQLNECANNWGLGGDGGSISASAGNSYGYGIYIYNCNAPVVCDNKCHDNAVTGVTSSVCQGGFAGAYGIEVYMSSNTILERNACWSNTATGGSSGVLGGGNGTAIGIWFNQQPAAKASDNAEFNQQGIGGLALPYGSSYHNGQGTSYGFRADSCPNILFINNLSYGNTAISFEKEEYQYSGSALGVGVGVVDSPGATLLHNTSERNIGIMDGNPGAPRAQGGQFHVYTSTNATLRNNSGGSSESESPGIRVDSASQSGFTSDYNNFYILTNTTSGTVGVCPSGYASTMTEWRSLSGQDPRSLSVDPQYWDVSAGNFHLRSSSPLIDAGVILAASGCDVDEEERPIDGPDADTVADADIGYDEFQDTDGDTLADSIEASVTLTSRDSSDSDADGLPDDWEVANDLNPNNSAGMDGGDGDPDEDGYTNDQEFQGNSNPNLASSIPNQPPVITSASPPGSSLFILEEDSVSLSATATDVNEEFVSYSWCQDGVEQSTSNQWSFVTTSESSGGITLSKEYQIELHVASGGDVVTRQWTVLVNNRNHRPVLAQMTNVTARAGDVIYLAPSYSDPDNANGVSGDDNLLSVQYSGFMTGPAKAVSAADGGTHSVTVMVQDDGSPVLTTQQTIDVRVIADGDSDGMADDWEMANGLNRDDPDDGASDPDGDGCKNMDEYIAGTNPQDPDSVFRITAIELFGSSVVIDLPTVGSKRYRIEQNVGLNEGDWTPVIEDVAGTGAIVRISVPNGATAKTRFYRAVVYR